MLKRFGQNLCLYEILKHDADWLIWLDKEKQIFKSAQTSLEYGACRIVT
jgi:hypothetical protein